MGVGAKQVAFLFHAITDVERARHFYGKILGLKRGMELEFAPGLWWIEFDLGETAIALCNAMSAPIAPVSCAALEVANLDEALAAVRAAGVPLSQGVQDYPPCRMFAVKDPDGNEIRLHQLKKAP